MPKENKSSMFLFDASRFVVDTLGWSNEQAGLHIRLLAMQWVNGDIEPEEKMLKDCSFFTKETWDAIKHKYKTNSRGHLYNERLEEDRARVEKNKQATRERAKNAAEARWNKQGAAVVPVVSESITQPVAPDTTSQHQHEPGELKYVKKEVTLAGNKVPIEYYDNGSYNCKQLNMWLSGMDMSMALAQTGLEQQHDSNFIAYVLTEFIKTTILNEDIAVKKISLSFKNFCTYKLPSLQKTYNRLCQTLDNFNKEVNALTDHPENKHSFIEYYTRRMPAGNLYYQQLQNPNVQSLWDEWNKGGKKQLRHPAKVSGKILTDADASQSDIVNHYRET